MTSSTIKLVIHDVVLFLFGAFPYGLEIDYENIFWYAFGKIEMQPLFMMEVLFWKKKIILANSLRPLDGVGNPFFAG